VSECTPSSGQTSSGPSIRRVLLAVHTGRADIVELARASAARLAKAGMLVRVLEDEAEALAIPDAEICSAGTQAAQGAEIVLVFGGDGTFLRAAELARTTDAALIGVNLGRVGFLAETEPEAVEDMLSAVEHCHYQVEERLTIEATVLDADGRRTGGTWALNEVSVEKVERPRVLDVVLAIDGHSLTSFGCDGVLCATPTGSTAYAFSAGGPVVWPDVAALLVVPTNAHALFARVNPTPFGDRLVAKFGLPVRGFRDSRSHGPGHEAPTSWGNVLQRGISTAHGVVSTWRSEVSGGDPDGAA
jgi:NAD+ kinase